MVNTMHTQTHMQCRMLAFIGKPQETWAARIGRKELRKPQTDYGGGWQVHGTLFTSHKPSKLGHCMWAFNYRNLMCTFHRRLSLSPHFFTGLATGHGRIDQAFWGRVRGLLLVVLTSSQQFANEICPGLALGNHSRAREVRPRGIVATPIRDANESTF